MANIRYFLSAYLGAYCSNSVFKDLGNIEATVIEKAKAFCLLAHNFAISFSEYQTFSRVSVEITRPFIATAFDYHKEFQKWKELDTVRLVNCAQLVLLSLYRSLNDFPDNNPAFAQRRLDYQKEINLVRSKIFKLDSEALLKFDEKHNVIKIEQQCVLDGATEETSLSMTFVEMSGSRYYQFLHTTHNLSNEDLAHEILLDPDCNDLDSFFGNATSHIPSAQQLEKTILLEIQQKPFDVKYIESLVEYIRSSLFKIIQSNDYTSLILETFNVEKIVHHYFEKDSIAYLFESYSILGNCLRPLFAEEHELVLNVYMSNLERKCKSDYPDVVMDLTSCLVTFYQMMCDVKKIAACAHMKKLSTVIRNHGVEYERGKFAEKMNKKIYMLQNDKVL